MDVRLPDGTIIQNVPDGTTKADLAKKLRANGMDIPDDWMGEKPKKNVAERALGLATPASAARALLTEEGRADLKAVSMGALRGVKDVIDTGAQYLSRLGPDGEAARVQAMNDAGKAGFERQFGDDPLASGARVGGNIAATYPVGGALAIPARAVGATRFANALQSGGMSVGRTAPTLSGKAVDMGIRSAGGASTGYVGAELVQPGAGGTGATVGAVLPPVAALAGKGGSLAADLVRPFTSSGQDRITGQVLRQFATNADQAAANMRGAAEVVPGSAPTAVMASGDEGLAGLSRTLQSADPRYAAELATRGAAQNAARTTALEEVAGNTGKLTLAKEARDAATEQMRETVLDAAGKLQARPVLASIDRLLAKPDNAGKISQAALNEVRNRVAQFAPDGQIDARALYAIRKDINDTLSGKLQGEAGNLKFASGQLVDVKKIIDEAIDLASRRVEMSSSRAVMPYGSNIERAGMAPPPNAGPRPTWQGYLDEYTQRSIPINQMEKLDEVLKAISTGTVDKSGNAVLSAAKLNNLLRNKSKDLAKDLAPEQLELLRRLSADLNASQLAANSGRAVGSNTVQNLAGNNLLTQALGNRLGGSTAAQSLVGRVLQIPYGTSNKMIQNRLGAALLDPQEAARLMQTPEGNALMKALTGGAAQIGYRSAPALSAQ